MDRKEMAASCSFHITGKGTLKGITLYELGTAHPKCHYLGGVPYAAPAIGKQRWKRARELPERFSYGTAEKPGDFTGASTICPQLGALSRSRFTMSEDCLKCNIWIPIGEPPTDGWPVWFFIHGGFLQSGSPNTHYTADLLYETNVKCIIVMPTYRINVLGFLACEELYQEALEEGSTVGNLGFWDQRLALEWTFKHIECFGGNMHNITIGGMSAGAHSAIYQLAFELFLPDSLSIIRRVVLWSNGPGVQTKSLQEVQHQFEELITILGISPKLEGKEKLARLRALPPNHLLKALSNMKLNSFRAITDGNFVRQSLFQEIEDGRFAQKMLRRGIRVMIGDLPDEATLYRLIRPPSSYEGLIDRLSVEYPRVTCQLLGRLYCPNRTPMACSTWQDTFGLIYTDMQIYVTARGFIASLAKTLPLDYIYRYRINWRARCVDRIYPKEMGVTHGSDLAIWFYGNGSNLLPAEKELVKRFLEPFAAFLRGNGCDWGTESIREVRALTSYGSIGIVEDEDWERSLKVWDSLENPTPSKL